MHSSTTLAEIYRQLVAIHYPLAEDPDGGRELQIRTRRRVEELMGTVEAAMEAERAGAPVSHNTGAPGA